LVCDWFGLVEKPGRLASCAAGDIDDFGMTFRSEDNELACVDEFWDELDELCDALWVEEL
jgi:hypothetical protein